MNDILWQIHNAGLINQLMSVEIGAGISFLEKSHIKFFDYSNKSYGSIFFPPVKKKNIKEIGESFKPNIFQLIDIPDSIDYSLINNASQTSCTIHEHIIGLYYKCNDGENENSFAEDRAKLTLNKTTKNFFHKTCFAFYSRFFYNRPKELDIFLSKLKFKDPYINLAKKIAYQIGNFSSIHFRLTDHSQNYFATSENRLKFLNQIKEKNNRLVFSTDDVDLIKKEFKKECLLVDEIILNFFKKEFLELEFHDNVVLGLISLLIMCESDYFIGTPGSTFSSYVHRQRFLNNKKDCFLYMDSSRCKDSVQNGPYSWNGYDCDTCTKNWWREWPECKLSIQS